jgi:phosphoglycolate phosphatase
MLNKAGVVCTVASNKPDAFSNQIVSALFGEGVFAFVRGKVDGAKAKPAPDVVFAIMERFGIPAEQTVMIGDSDVDVITAHNAGIKCIGCEWGFRGRRELENAGADYIAANPCDISGIVKSI